MCSTYKFSGASGWVCRYWMRVLFYGDGIFRRWLRQAPNFTVKYLTGQAQGVSEKAKVNRFEVLLNYFVYKLLADNSYIVSCCKCGDFVTRSVPLLKMSMNFICCVWFQPPRLLPCKDVTHSVPFCILT